MNSELFRAYDALYQRAADWLPLKQAAARASTVGAILIRSYAPHRKIRMSDAEILAAFPLLDEDRQETILGIFPDRIPLSSMTGALEGILDKPKISNGSLRVSALQALVKVNAERGRARIIAEIREPHVDSLYRLLIGLPDQTLPEVDEVLVSRLENNDSPTRDIDAELIGRYASGAIFDRVKQIYDKAAGAWNCAAADALMRYFLRFDQVDGPNVILARAIRKRRCR